ncbi:serine/threonine-protein kinase [Pyrus ussuriensis x Pyrus communis]|uniref:non-specific serine/threonine protein kinase n=1 Tax=Pyrus ussuriensis x Pyrus communis TaxID=2448454 RepID=A0A5N5F6K2_9ROSA|nr:serine/threonine-protein kinase [Pyrus ussuriensis x Pyrus communis]
MSSSALSLKKRLLKPTSFFGVKSWVLLVIFIALFTVVTLIISLLCVIHYRRRKSSKSNFRLPNPIVSKTTHDGYCNSSLDRRLLSRNMSDIEMNSGKLQQHGRVFSDQLASPQASGRIQNSSAMELGPVSMYSQMVKDVWRGKKFSLKELEVATNGFSKQNLIGNGDYGIVYHGILFDNTRVAVKRLVSDRFQVEDFIAQMEVIGFVRHKNLVKLLGYHIERAYRLLVLEYVDNRSLHHWLHECSKLVSPLTWSIRLKIIQGIAKGLAYLHEDIEPKILHRSLISSNVLLDHQWDPKVSNFGLAKLYNPEWGINIMESLGYIAPEYASTGDFTEKSDIYSFGVLVMEIITGRSPIDRSQPQPYVVDWLKSMVAGQKIACVVDPKMLEKPSLKELKRVLLVALRCVDPDSEHRPQMGEVIHMLELRDLMFCDSRTGSMA